MGIDGKAIRGSKKHGAKALVHMVSAWANKNHLVLGQVKVDERSNEITAIPKLLGIPSIKGCVVAIDAMGCQAGTAKKIIEKEADYLLAVKGNQGTLEQGINETVLFCRPMDSCEKLDFGHVGIGTRKRTVYTDPSHISQLSKWKGLKSIVKIDPVRYFKLTGKEEKETRLYISGLEASALEAGHAVRAHRGVENSLHWVLDVAFNEDKSLKTNTNAAQNFSTINRIALNLLKNDTSKKIGVKGKRLIAGWNTGFLLQILKN